ncbi:MAG: glycosyltransferase [Calothrix sp. C42_A2020_038]|nr:glycosyltransferase [Calothrix sp. C42_A2020_038]
MKVAVISAFPPTKDNIGAPTALPYQILNNILANLDIDLYYFPASDKYKEIVSKDISRLPLRSVCELQSPKNKFIQKYIRWKNRKEDLPPGVALFPPIREAIKKINLSKPDAVWLYPHWLTNWVKYINCQNILVSGMDSAVLHNERVIKFGNWHTFEEISPEFKLLRQNTNLEKKLGTLPVKVHMVGLEDVRKYASVSRQPHQAFYIPHPHYDYVPIQSKLTDNLDKITILFSGGGNTVYVGDHLVRIINSLIEQAKSLSPHFKFLFIGSGYESFQLDLKNVGYTVEYVKWVDNYSEAISRALIQIFPIAVGTGTKGKVLQALATGILGIGSEFAFENINIKPGEDYILYTRPEDVASNLLNVKNNLLVYERMANSAAVKVRTNHSPEYTSRLFWQEFLKLDDQVDLCIQKELIKT